MSLFGCNRNEKYGHAWHFRHFCHAGIWLMLLQCACMPVRWVFNGKSFINVMFRWFRHWSSCIWIYTNERMHGYSSTGTHTDTHGARLNKMETKPIVYYVWMKFYMNLMLELTILMNVFLLQTRSHLYLYCPNQPLLFRLRSLLLLLLLLWSLVWK